MRALTPLAVAAAMATPLSAENRIDLVRPDAPALAGYAERPVGVRELEFVNPDQVDVVNATAEDAPTYDRSLTVEVWYPAADGTEPGTIYSTVIRDGVTPTELAGRAARDAVPAADGPFPLVILSHGYPGNRFLMSHLGETLASRGYVVASIDHPDSTYSDQAAFGSTLLNRPWDQKFVLDSMAALDDDLGAITDADTAAVVGYSMGGYGALIYAGAGVTEAAVDFDFSPPGGLLSRNLAGSDTMAELDDPRVKAFVAFAPWGMNTGFWDAEGLSAITAPLLLIAGSVDDVAGYPAIREIFEDTTGTTRHLLTFVNGNHNSGAPIPAPEESWLPVPTLDFVPFDHYADPVWDNVRMNNIAQHFVAAFLDLNVKGDADMQRFLDLVPDSNDGVVALDEAGQLTAEDTYWTGFPPRTAVGLRFETLPAH